MDHYEKEMKDGVLGEGEVNEEVKKEVKEDIKEEVKKEVKEEIQEEIEEGVKERVKEGYRLKEDNRGVGIVEIILILVILIALVLLFQTQIKDIVTRALESISNNVNSMIS